MLAVIRVRAARRGSRRDMFVVFLVMVKNGGLDSGDFGDLWVCQDRCGGGHGAIAAHSARELAAADLEEERTEMILIFGKGSIMKVG